MNSINDEFSENELFDADSIFLLTISCSEFMVGSFTRQLMCATNNNFKFKFFCFHTLKKINTYVERFCVLRRKKWKGEIWRERGKKVERNRDRERKGEWEKEKKRKRKERPQLTKRRNHFSYKVAKHSL